MLLNFDKLLTKINRGILFIIEGFLFMLFHSAKDNYNLKEKQDTYPIFVNNPQYNLFVNPYHRILLSTDAFWQAQSCKFLVPP